MKYIKNITDVLFLVVVIVTIVIFVNQIINIQYSEGFDNHQHIDSEGCDDNQSEMQDNQDCYEDDDDQDDYDDQDSDCHDDKCVLENNTFYHINESNNNDSSDCNHDKNKLVKNSDGNYQFTVEKPSVEQINYICKPKTKQPKTQKPKTQPPIVIQKDTPKTQSPIIIQLPPQTQPPQTPAPQTPAPQTPAPQTPAPQTQSPVVCQTVTPQTQPPVVCQTVAPQTSKPVVCQNPSTVVYQAPSPVYQTPSPVYQTRSPVYQTRSPFYQTPSPVYQTRSPVVCKTNSPVSYSNQPSVVYQNKPSQTNSTVVYHTAVPNTQNRVTTQKNYQVTPQLNQDVYQNIKHVATQDYTSPLTKQYPVYYDKLNPIQSLGQTDKYLLPKKNDQLSNLIKDNYKYLNPSDSQEEIENICPKSSRVASAPQTTHHHHYYYNYSDKDINKLNIGSKFMNLPRPELPSERVVSELVDIPISNLPEYTLPETTLCRKNYEIPVEEYVENESPQEVTLVESEPLESTQRPYQEMQVIETTDSQDNVFYFRAKLFPIFVQNKSDYFGNCKKTNKQNKNSKATATFILDKNRKTLSYDIYVESITSDIAIIQLNKGLDLVKDKYIVLCNKPNYQDITYNKNYEKVYNIKKPIKCPNYTSNNHLKGTVNVKNIHDIYRSFNKELINISIHSCNYQHGELLGILKKLD